MECEILAFLSSDFYLSLEFLAHICTHAKAMTGAEGQGEG